MFYRLRVAGVPMDFPLRGGILIFFFCCVKRILLDYYKNYQELGVYNKHYARYCTFCQFMVQ